MVKTEAGRHNGLTEVELYRRDANDGARTEGEDFIPRLSVSEARYGRGSKRRGSRALDNCAGGMASAVTAPVLHITLSTSHRELDSK